MEARLDLPAHASRASGIAAERTGQSTALRLLHYLAAVRGLFLLSFVLLFLISGLTAAKALIIQPVVDSFRRDAAGQVGLLAICGLIFGIFLLQAVLSFFYSMVSRTAGSRILRAVREDLFAHVVRQGIGYCVEHRSGDLTSRIVNDVASFETAAVAEIQGLVRDGMTLLFLFGVMLYNSRPLASLCFLVLAGIGALLYGLNRSIRLLSRRVQEMISGISRQLIEMIGGLELVLTFGLASFWQARFRELNRRHYETVSRLQRVSFAGVAAVQALMGLGIAAIFFVTARALVRGEITEGQFLSFLGTMYLLQAPAVGIVEKATSVSRGFAAANRALELLNDEAGVKEPETSIPLPDTELGFRFQDVTFAYDQSPVLREVSFEVAPRGLVVLMGESGGGKTTVARLLLRFYLPQQGVILLGGTPVMRLSRADLSRTVGYVSQDVFLLDDTIRANLVLGRPQASEEEIAAVLRISCLDALVAELPQGLETLVGERGLQLSGGQRQRIAIARALLMEPRLLILDEATSALDSALERHLLLNLLESSRQRTIFAITHRPAVASLADRVLILRDGKVVESNG